MVPTKHQPCQPYTIQYLNPHWQEIKIAGFLPGRQAQSSERCVCQSRDLESVHVHSDVKCSMFKAQTGILSPPPNPHAYCIIHKTSIDDCIRGLQLFLFCCEANSSRDFNLVPHNAIFLYSYSSRDKAQGHKKYHKWPDHNRHSSDIMNVAIMTNHHCICFHKGAPAVSSARHSHDSG